MKIEDYAFGRIKVGGKTYTNDVIVFRDSVFDNWWRKEGHSLCPEDLERVARGEVKRVIIGCGASSAMRVPGRTLEWLKSKELTAHIMDTASAVQQYNKYADDPETAACLHLTC